MKLLLVISLVFVSLIFSSCLLSANPMITDENIKSFPSSIGTWKDNEGSAIKIEMFLGSSTELEGLSAKNSKVESKEKRLSKMSPQESKTMLAIQLVSYIENNLKHELILAFTSIGHQWFAQLCPLRVYKVGKPYYDERYNVLRDNSLGEYPMEKAGYSFYRVETASNELRFTPVNDDYLLDLINKGRVSIPFEKDKLFETNLITASPEVLRKFFEKYGNDSRLFDKSSTLVLKRSLQ